MVYDYFKIEVLCLWYFTWPNREDKNLFCFFFKTWNANIYSSSVPPLQIIVNNENPISCPIIFYINQNTRMTTTNKHTYYKLQYALKIKGKWRKLLRQKKENSMAYTIWYDIPIILHVLVKNSNEMVNHIFFIKLSNVRY